MTTPNTSSASCDSPYVSRLAPEMICELANSIAPVVRAIPGRMATSDGLMISSRPFSAVSATNQVASRVTSIADKVGRIGISDGNGRPSWTVVPTTRPRKMYAGNALHVGLIIMPKPNVVTAYPTVVATGPNRGRMRRASAIAVTASAGLMAPASARLAMSSIRPAALSCSEECVEPSIWAASPTWTISIVGRTATRTGSVVYCAAIRVSRASTIGVGCAISTSAIPTSRSIAAIIVGSKVSGGASAAGGILRIAAKIRLRRARLVSLVMAAVPSRAPLRRPAAGGISATASSR